MSINFNELRELLGAIAQTDIAELTLKTDSFELAVRKGAIEATPIVVAAPEAVAAAVTPSTQALAPAPSPAPVTSLPPPIDKKWVAITSPMVGTFYRASAPDESAFVEISDRVRTGQTVCIIEAMKLMNEIEAEISGQVMEIAVTNGEPVEYGQPLMWVNPD